MLKETQNRAGHDLPSISGDFACPPLAAYSAHSRWARTVCGCGLLIASLSTTSCLFQKQPRVFIPPTVVKTPAPPVTMVSIVLPAAPEISPDIPSRPDIDLPTVSELPHLPTPPAPRPATPKPARTVEVAPVVVEIPPIQTPPAAVPVQILTADERRVYSTSFDAAMERVRNAVARVDGRSLSAEQRDIANRVKTFQSQAEQMKTQDLVTAVNLATNADLLARDLLRRLNLN